MVQSVMIIFWIRGTQKVHSPSFQSVRGLEQWQSNAKFWTPNQKAVNPKKTFELCIKGDASCPYQCKMWHIFSATSSLNLGMKGVGARRRHWCNCSLVSVLLYLFFTVFMAEKADSQQYAERNKVRIWRAISCKMGAPASGTILVQNVAGSRADFCSARFSWSSVSSDWREAALAHGQTFRESVENSLIFLFCYQ